VLFDLPHVIDAVLTQPSMRLDFVRGSFFESIPTGGDVYVLKNILHDWEDSRAKQILAKCRSAMTAEARLLIIENLVCGPNKACQGKNGDIAMMVRNGGRNRQTLRVIATHGGPDVLEAALRDEQSP
jgi:hypothetical protein